MLFLVFDTEAAASKAASTIFSRMRTLFAEYGHATTGNAIIGKYRGQNAPNSKARTTAYAVPRQRADGKWVIPHPATCPSYDFPDLTGTKMGDRIAQVELSLVIEEYQDSWFPEV